MIIETISVGRISEKDSGLHIAEIGLVFQAKNRYTNRVNPGHQPASLNSKKGSAERMKIERFSLLKRAVSWLLVLLFLTASLAARAQNQTVVAWGDNRYGQATVPGSASNTIAISAGSSHNLALRADGTVIAWGRNNYNQTNVPAGLSNVVAIAASGKHNLALQAEGRVVAWGSNLSGQTNVPDTLSEVVAIATRGDHCLAARLDGRVAGWGLPYAGSTNML